MCWCYQFYCSFGTHTKALLETCLTGGTRPGQTVSWKGIDHGSIDSLDKDEVEKLYTLYEARLGAAMTNTLEHATLQLYSGVVSMFLPIPPERQLALVCDLEADPFVGHALNSATCVISSLHHVCSTTNHRTNHGQALSIWTSLFSDNKQWQRT